jgi:hypothetical protein
VIHRFILLRIVLLASFVAFAAHLAFSQRLPPTPRLPSGEILFYRIDFNLLRNARTESRITSPQMPAPENIDTSALLQVEIVEASASGLRLKTYYSERGPSSGPPPSPIATPPSADKMIEVSLSSDGSASKIKGFDQLSPTQQFAWNVWLNRFTSPMAFAKSGLVLGQRWQSSEPETASSPIASLLWLKKYQYIRDEPCNTVSTSQLCAVILVRATLRQKSSPKNATPEDYKLRNLKTRGTATAQNETVLYVSHSTGVLMRSVEDAQQSMDAVIALADGSNEIHYLLKARSHSEILLLPDSRTDVH